MDRNQEDRWLQRKSLSWKINHGNCKDIHSRPVMLRQRDNANDDCARHKGDAGTMRGFVHSSVCALALTACSGVAQAETAQSGTASAHVLDTIQFAVLLNMNFGKVAVNGPGVIELNPADGSRSCDPSLVCAGGFDLSELRLTGSDAAVKVVFDPTFELTGPGDPILTEPLFPGGSGATVVIQNGEAVVKFGARLHINLAQTPGIYSGDFSVNLEYN